MKENTTCGKQKGYLRLQENRMTSSKPITISQGPKSMELLRMNQRDFADEIVRRERMEFGDTQERFIRYPSGDEYLRFAPSWHFMCGIISREMIEDVKLNNRQVLSVGSGYSWLEKFLVRNFDINPDQITLSDLNGVMPSGFKRVSFDMFQKWPFKNESFDYILFPESIIFKMELETLEEIIAEALSKCKIDGQIRLSGSFLMERFSTEKKEHQNIGEIPDYVQRLINIYPNYEFVYGPNLLVVIKHSK
jgi:hypothetical protein